MCRVPVTRAANKHACRLASVMWFAEKGLSNPDVLTAEFREQEREKTSERIWEGGNERERGRERETERPWVSLLAVLERQHLVTMDVAGEQCIVADP